MILINEISVKQAKDFTTGQTSQITMSGLFFIRNKFSQSFANFPSK